MLLSSLLDPELVKVRVKATNRAEIIHQLLEEMFKHYQFQLSFEDVLGAVRAREELGGTVFPTGLSVPHARIDLFNDILIGVATLKTPIEENGVEVRMVVLILTSKTTSNLYLNSLAAFAKLSQNQEMFAKILSSSSPSELLGVIQAATIEVKKELTVEHIMTHPLISVQPETTIRQIIDNFVENDLSYLPVVDAEGNFKGECTVLEILQLGIPNYAQLIGNINFLKTFEPLEELLDKEDSIQVKDVMEQPTHSFTRSTSIVEAVSSFIKSRRRQIPVMENGKIVGVVSYMDIIKKVLRG